MLEKFLAVLERIADAVEVIAAAKTGNDAPRTQASTPTTSTKTAEPEQSAEDKAKAEQAAKRKAAREAKAAKEAASSDPMDPLGGDPLGGEEKKEYTEKEVRDILAKVIDQDGRTAAFEILKTKGGGAKSFTDLKKDHFEDVYVECQERLAA